MNNDLMGCVNALGAAWKDHFGLGTQYVGYLTVRHVVALMSLYRYSDDRPQTVHGINDAIGRMNRSGDVPYYVPEFWLDSDAAPVLKKLLQVLDQREDVIIFADSEEWQRLMTFLYRKAQVNGLPTQPVPGAWQQWPV